MKALMLKDFLVLKGIYLILCGFTLLLIILSFFLDSISALVLFLPLYSLMIPLSSFSLDERSKWSGNALTMPVKRKDLVISKYILGICTNVLVFILMISLDIVSSNFSKSSLTIAVIIFFVGIILTSILYPIVLKFGVEKGKIIVFSTLGLLGAVIGFLFGRIRSLTSNPDFNNQFFDTVIDNLPLIIAIVAVVFLFVSFVISNNIYKKNDF